MVLHQKSQTLITIITILITTTSIATIARAQNSSSCKLTCGSGKSAKSVQYPFGFSEGCVIPLNCSDKNEIKLGEFTVQNVTRSSIFVHLPAQCNRRYQSIAPLFGPNFGPSRNNTLLFQNCTSPPPGCQIPAEFVQKRFNLSSCDNITCMSQAPNGSDIMRFEDLNRTRCKYLFGSFSVQSGRDSLLSLEFETLQLGWWVYTGLCECHLNATSTPLGCRCSCNAGFDGDGFKLGSGCQPVSQPEDDTKKGLTFPAEDRSKGDNEGVWFHVSMVFGFIVGFWAVCGTLVLKKSWRLRSFLQLLYGNRSSSTNASQGQFPAMGVSKVGHGYLMPQSLRLFSTNSRPRTKRDTKVLNGGEDKVQQSHHATSTRLNFAYWFKWMLGSILSLMLPFWAQNWGKLKRIEGKAEIVMEEVENVAEVVEKVANVAEKVSADVADELPDNSKLKETVLLVERASKVAAQDAQLTQDLIHKVETLKQDLGDLETLAEPLFEKIEKRVI